MRNRMSNDRVKFRISKCRLYGNAGVRDALQETMGLSNSEISDACRRATAESCDEGGEYIEIVCRPSQFARFLIIRNIKGCQNGFKELNPVLFMPEENRQPLDASGNPNTVWKDRHV